MGVTAQSTLKNVAMDVYKARKESYSGEGFNIKRRYGLGLYSIAGRD